MGLLNTRTYLFAAAFVAGNIILPQLCHLIPQGGLMLLPIYFFTLIAGYKFGLRVGLLTAILSPLINFWLFNMPPLPVLPIILVKSTFLAVAASLIASNTQKISFLHIAFVVIAYQFFGGMAEAIMTGSMAAPLQDITLGLPGIILQIVGGWLVLRLLAKYEF
ncbi:MAG: ECF transporter S component [Odoribacter sp.]|nr:ECF transporter S component [Odoribacter sp.]